MARETISHKVVETKERFVEETKLRCDKCGRDISDELAEEEDEDLYPQELLIYLNPDLCVNQKLRRDYCRGCLLPIWDKLCELLGADPEDSDDFD